jgi:hypothetical protein
MTTTATTAGAPPAAQRRYPEQIHALVTRETRELLMGLALLDAGPARPREGETIRALLDDAITALYTADPKRYADAVRRGRKHLRTRDAERRASGQ